MGKQSLYEFVSNIKSLRALKRRKPKLAKHSSQGSWYVIDSEDIKRKITLDPNRANRGIVTKTEIIRNEYGEIVGKNITKYRQEIKGFTEEGDIILGKVDITSFNTKNKVVNEYVSLTNAMSRLDNGFDTLLQSFRMAGVSEQTLTRLRRKWDLLNDQKKSMVFKDYRSSTFDIGYGSDSFDERRTNTVGAEDVDYYVNALETAIDMANDLGYIDNL